MNSLTEELLQKSKVQDIWIYSHSENANITVAGAPEMNSEEVSFENTDFAALFCVYLQVLILLSNPQ